MDTIQHSFDRIRNLIQHTTVSFAYYQFCQNMNPMSVLSYGHDRFRWCVFMITDADMQAKYSTEAN